MARKTTAARRGSKKEMLARLAVLKHEREQLEDKLTSTTMHLADVRGEIAAMTVAEEARRYRGAWVRNPERSDSYIHVRELNYVGGLYEFIGTEMFYEDSEVFPDLVGLSVDAHYALHTETLPEIIPEKDALAKLAYIRDRQDLALLKDGFARKGMGGRNGRR